MPAPPAPPAATVPERVPAGSVVEQLGRILSGIDRTPAACLGSNTSRRQDVEFINCSPLTAPLGKLGRGGGWKLLQEAAEADAGCGAAVGAMLGLAIGDSVGHPLEFTAVDQSLPDGPGGTYLDLQRPCVLPVLEKDKYGEHIGYCKSYNRFQLLGGQWTDDTSMSLCLADSLLVHGGYHGGDARVRWHMWWVHGYCNSFREDVERPTRHSVGLGGNVAKSLGEIERIALGMECPADVVPEIYESPTNDAGNGTIMRLAPVPIAYHNCMDDAMAVAVAQSRATHPSCDAAACCCFMTFFIIEAIRAHADARSPGDRPREFIEAVVAAFLQRIETRESLGGMWEMVGGGRAEAISRLRQLLNSAPRGPKEQNWTWRSAELPIQEAITARGMGPDGRYDPSELYNGHPVIPTYFGAYCMDGLAMALWSLWHSDSFSSCIVRVVNLLGDADTTGAIAGQMAGALYGLKGIRSCKWGLRCIHSLAEWDPRAEIGIRAALLYHFLPQVEVRQIDGFPAVRVFERPEPGARVVVEIPNGERAQQRGRVGDFVQLSWRSATGWVGVKNVLVLTRLPPPAVYTRGSAVPVAPAGGASAYRVRPPAAAVSSSAPALAPPGPASLAGSLPPLSPQRRPLSPQPPRSPSPQPLAGDRSPAPMPEDRAVRPPASPERLPPVDARRPSAVQRTSFGAPKLLQPPAPPKPGSSGQHWEEDPVPDPPARAAVLLSAPGRREELS